ncbi:MAG: hypothetical protein GFH27_549357n32 [Chloroflexi bacterium AL-W]|nr:hypothetical protein [Chloroflexi bacterium AL-N1]NOK70669.1 hypothetical protein [Chloroflexi bacterium AL-N10]NOK78488.1 hypothetical protein [Chloroflexi bacterium AL-N5]NOK85572.1 hypothetical protein [Chloroflexi bacterium AL-W]NOK92486.1 hypothetical protein [Chloroflexi bacterium AL-N15]
MVDSPVLTTTQRTRRPLQIVRWVALANALLLVTLVTASVMDNREWVSVLGPLHGGNFMLLLTIVGVGAVDKLWSWWFPVGVFFTGGPLGALIGEWIISRRLARQEPLDHHQE